MRFAKNSEMEEEKVTGKKRLRKYDRAGKREIIKSMRDASRSDYKRLSIDTIGTR
ncbi:MAG: hypothetical protein MUE44_18380 [Oscillatoriaceae cyanobacterium Prado104]|nr:hypothetical protein [Oscillatoriaceae cyanobacterium Prado104]